MEVSKFITRYPNIYHMAEVNTWDSIRQFGLLSTTSILDLHGVVGEERVPYESQHRASMMQISTNKAPSMMLRDQKPMSDTRLKSCLRNNITPREWYEFLNKKVFFWATEKRLLRLLGARAYRNKTHEVLTIDTASFMEVHCNQVQLCHMNSGNTFPIAFPRDYSIFTSITDFPSKKSGLPLKEVAEVTLPFKAINIHNHVKTVRLMTGSTVISTLYE